MRRARDAVQRRTVEKMGSAAVAFFHEQQGKRVVTSNPRYIP